MGFLNWITSRGGKVHAQLDLFRELGSGERGVVAQSDIAEGELLILLPITCALYIPNQEEYAKNPDAFPPAVKYLREAHPELSPFLATTLVLMSEMSRGSASPWAPYMTTLPPSCPDCLLHWSAEDKLELEGTALEESGPDPAADVYQRHVAPTLAARQDLWLGLSGSGEAAAVGAVASGSAEAAAAPPAAAAAAGSGAAAGAAGASGNPAAAGLQAFLRTAGLVQSRAFHLEADNWVSGAKEISKLEGGATQVFLLPGIDMINHSHNPARRNARLERLNVAEAAAASLLGQAAPGGAAATGGKDGAAAPALMSTAEAYFVMRADKPIKAGEEVLHTYGDLSDGQLLQTYGFLDSEDDIRPAAAAAAGDAAGTSVAAGGSSAASKKKRAKTSAAEAAEAEAAPTSNGYRNPYNAVLVPWSTVEEVCTGLLRNLDQAPSASLQRAKRDFLAAAGVLQSAAPEATQFVLLAREPLPEELTTAVQVLLMTKEEFQELRREFGGEGPAAAAAAAGRSRSKAKGGKAARGKANAAAATERGAGGGQGPEQGPGGQQQQQQLPKLSLGTSLLEEDEDFAEMVCIASLQVLDACLERYPTTVKEDVRLLRTPDCVGRERLAVRVRLGEKDVLQLAKKALVDLLRKLRAGTLGQAKADNDDGGAGEEGAAEEDEEEDGEQDAGGADKEAAGTKAREVKRQRLGLGAADQTSGGDGDGDEEGDEGGDGTSAEMDGDDGLLLGSDDSDKVGYAGVEYDDGIGEAHDRGKAHEAPKDDA